MEPKKCIQLKNVIKSPQFETLHLNFDLLKQRIQTKRETSGALI